MEAAYLHWLVDLDATTHSFELAVGVATAAMRCLRAEVPMIGTARCGFVIVHGWRVVVLVVLQPALRVVDCLVVIVPWSLVVAAVSCPAIASLLITDTPVTGLPNQLVQLA